MLTFILSDSCLRTWSQDRRTLLKTHLVNLIPLRVDSLVDDITFEELRSEFEDAVRVWLAFDQPSEELVFTHQVLGFYKVDPQEALRNRGVSIWVKTNMTQQALTSPGQWTTTCPVLPWEWGNGAGPAGTLPPEGWRYGWAEPGRCRWCLEWCCHTNHWRRRAGEMIEWHEFKGLFELKAFVSW